MGSRMQPSSVHAECWFVYSSGSDYSESALALLGTVRLSHVLAMITVVEWIFLCDQRGFYERQGAFESRWRFVSGERRHD